MNRNTKTSRKLSHDISVADSAAPPQAGETGRDSAQSAREKLHAAFAELNAKLDPIALAKIWMPGGDASDPLCYKPRNPKRDDRTPGTFWVQADGRWVDWATPETKGSDVISLFAWLHELTPNAARKELQRRLDAGEIHVRSQEANAVISAVQQAKSEADGQQTKVPSLPRPEERTFRLPNRSAVYLYHDESGQWLLAAKARAEGNAALGIKKVFRPYTPRLFADGTRGWRSGGSIGFLYGLEQIAASSLVVVFEGEKKAYEVRRVLRATPGGRSIACVSLPNGAKSAATVDLEPLRGRKVVLWPDNDGAGRDTASTLTRRIPDDFSIVPMRPEWPHKYDAADLIAQREYDEKRTAEEIGEECLEVINSAVPPTWSDRVLAIAETIDRAHLKSLNIGPLRAADNAQEQISALYLAHAQEITRAVPHATTEREAIAALKQLAKSFADDLSVDQIADLDTYVLREVARRRHAALELFSLTARDLSRDREHVARTIDEIPLEPTADECARMLTPGRITFVVAGMGAGKTRRVAAPMIDALRRSDCGRRAIALVHLESLADELSRQWGGLHYRKSHGHDDTGERLLITCVNSLGKYGYEAFSDAEQRILIIDEAAQVIRRLARLRARCHGRASMGDVYDRLCDTIRDPKTTILLMDATLDRATVQFIESLRAGSFDFLFVAPQDTGKRVEYHFSGKSFVHACAHIEGLLTDRGTGGLAIACESKTKARALATWIKQKWPKRSVLQVDSDNKESPEQKAFLACPDDSTCDVLIYTSVVQSGVNIRSERFTHGVLIASGATMTPSDALQMCGRARAVKEWAAFVAPSRVALLPAKNRLAAMADVAAKPLTPYEVFAAEVDEREAKAKNQFCSGLFWAFEHARWNPSLADTIDDLAPVVDTDAERERVLVGVATAREIDRLHAEKLRSNRAGTVADDSAAAELWPGLTGADLQEAISFALRRHTIGEALRLSDEDRSTSDVEAWRAWSSVWDEGAGIARLERYLAATGRGVDSADRLTLARRHGAAMQRAYAELAAMVGMPTWVSTSGEVRWSKDQARALVAALAADEPAGSSPVPRRQILAALGILPRKWLADVAPRVTQPGRELIEIYGRMGIKVRSVDSGRRGKSASSPSLGEVNLPVTRDKTEAPNPGAYIVGGDPTSRVARQRPAVKAKALEGLEAIKTVEGHAARLHAAHVQAAQRMQQAEAVAEMLATAGDDEEVRLPVLRPTWTLDRRHTVGGIRTTTTRDLWEFARERAGGLSGDQRDQWLARLGGSPPPEQLGSPLLC